VLIEPESLTARKDEVNVKGEALVSQSQESTCAQHVDFDDFRTSSSSMLPREQTGPFHAVIQRLSILG
jgi:hypothetical protein